MEDPNYSFLFQTIIDRSNNDSCQPTILEDHSVILTEVDPEKLLRRLPYYENKDIIPTSDLPTLGGIHISQKNLVAFTLRFSDLKFYSMNSRIFIKNTNILSLRCSKSSRCKAKCRIIFKGK